MSATHTVALRADTVHRIIDDGTYPSVRALALAAGVSPSTLTRVMRGDTDIGAATIAALLHETGLPFAELFTIETDEHPDPGDPLPGL